MNRSTKFNRLLYIGVIILCITGCSGKDIPVLRAVDTENEKIVILTGDKTTLQNFYAADFVILGGSIGGIAAAISLCSAGRTALLVEETDRLVGSFPPGELSCISDNEFIETSGSSKTYQTFRKKLLEWYEKQSKPLPDRPHNPSPQGEHGPETMCVENEAILDVLHEMLEKKIEQEFLTVIKRHKVAKVVMFTDRIASLIAIDLDEKTANQFTGWMFIDATQHGDLIPLLGIESTSESEIRPETNEPHAPEASDNLSNKNEFYYTDPVDALPRRERSKSFSLDLTKRPGNRKNSASRVKMRNRRRIVGRKRIAEQDISSGTFKGPRARFFNDSIGIGWQPMYIKNPDSDSKYLKIVTKPFQIPLGLLVTKDCRNLLMGGRTVSTTHITSSAFNTPSVEWAIGEAAGIAAAYCAGHKVFTKRLVGNIKHIRGLQKWLVRLRGVPIYWYNDVTPYDDDFLEAQMKPYTDPDYHKNSGTLSYRK